MFQQHLCRRVHLEPSCKTTRPPSPEPGRKTRREDRDVVPPRPRCRHAARTGRRCSQCGDAIANFAFRRRQHFLLGPPNPHSALRRNRLSPTPESPIARPESRWRQQESQWRHPESQIGRPESNVLPSVTDVRNQESKVPDCAMPSGTSESLFRCAFSRSPWPPRSPAEARRRRSPPARRGEPPA